MRTGSILPFLHLGTDLLGFEKSLMMSLISCNATAATIIASDSVAADNIAARDDCSLADRMVSYFCLNINLHFCNLGPRLAVYA